MAELRTGSAPEHASHMLSLALISWLKQLRVEDLFVTCLTCRKLCNDGRTCSYDNSVPAVHVVLQGCEHYEDVTGQPVAGKPPAAYKKPAYTYGHGDDIPF